MAICTRCGAIMHELDMNDHVCEPENVPVQGIEISRDGTTKTVSKKVL